VACRRCRIRGISTRSVTRLAALRDRKAVTGMQSQCFSRQIAAIALAGPARRDSTTSGTG